MLLFKTSGLTLKSVILNKKHALNHMPKDWEENEILLISKNKKDCSNGEKQIQYLMILDKIKRLEKSEINKYWPESNNNWNFLVTCSAVKTIVNPFDLKDILGNDSKKYNPSLKPMKLTDTDEKRILEHLKSLKLI